MNLQFVFHFVRLFNYRVDGPAASINLMNSQSEWIKQSAHGQDKHRCNAGERLSVKECCCCAINLVHNHKFTGYPLNIRIRLRISITFSNFFSSIQSAIHLPTCITIPSSPTLLFMNYVQFKFNKVFGVQRTVTSSLKQ